MTNHFTQQNKTYIQCDDTFYCITHLHHRQLTVTEITEENYHLNYHIYTKDRLDKEGAIWKKATTP